MNESAPTITVVMPLYNKMREVSRAIDSVLAQTFGDFELVVVDDGSTDGGSQLIESYTDPRIRMIRQTNAGVSAARNRGIAEARTELVAFLDADDEWAPMFLETIVNLREKYPTSRVFATSYAFCYQEQHARQAILKAQFPPNGHNGILSNYFKVAAHSDPPICSSAVAVSKEAIASVGGFPSKIIAGEDLLTWARLAARYDIAYSKIALAKFWAPAKMGDRPTRIPQQPDMVAEGLNELLEVAPHVHINGLREYIAVWHRMRAIVYLKLNRGSDARQEIRRAYEHCGINIRLCIMQAISILPGRLPSSMQQVLSRGLDLARSIASQG